MNYWSIYQLYKGKYLYIISYSTIDKMTAKRVMISVEQTDYMFLKKHPEINKSELFRAAVKEYREKHFFREVPA